MGAACAVESSVPLIRPDLGSEIQSQQYVHVVTENIHKYVAMGYNSLC